MTEKLRVAAIGTGYFSQYHYDAWSLIEDVELVALCTRSNAARAKEIADRYRVPAVYFDPERMLAEVEVDLVDVITPPETHADLVALAAGRGVPIVCQKPVAPTRSEAVAIAETAEGAGVALIIHENWRFKPWIREIRKLLSESAIGTPYNITFRMRPGDGQGPGAYLDRQPYFQKMPRFLVHETGIHVIDVFRFLFGEISAVSARLRRLNPAIAGEDAGLVLFEFASGAHGLLDANRLVDFDADNPRLTMGVLIVEGSDGQLRLDGYGNIWRRSHGGDVRKHDYQWTNRAYGGDCVHAFQRHVTDHLLRGTPVENTARAYIANLDVEEAIYRSNETRRVVDLA